MSFAESPVIRCLQWILILKPDKENRVVLVVLPTEAGAIFQAVNDSRCSNQPPHVQCAHDEDLLCTSEGHGSPCIGLFFLGSLFLRWELMETFPVSPTVDYNVSSPLLRSAGDQPKQPPAKKKFPASPLRKPSLV